jgi:hypothetical protein
MKFQKGDIIEMDGLLGVVTQLPNEKVPEDHIGIWFGEENPKRIPEGGEEEKNPEVCAVPEEYCKLAKAPTYKH